MSKPPIKDTFRGNNCHLRKCIKALIELSDEGAISPCGLGSHARTLLSACYWRLIKPKFSVSKPQPIVSSESVSSASQSTLAVASGVADGLPSVWTSPLLSPDAAKLLERAESLPAVEYDGRV